MSTTGVDPLEEAASLPEEVLEEAAAGPLEEADLREEAIFFLLVKKNRLKKSAIFK